MALQEVERKRRVEYSGAGARRGGEPRGSTTDPQARTMRMANGGYRPGYNVQFAADAGHGVIVAVSVTNSDSGQAPPMIEQRTGRRPKEYLVDAAYTDKKSVERLDELDGAVPERSGQDPFQPQLTDSAAVSAWSKRMGSAAGQEIYKGARAHHRAGQRGRPDLPHHGSDARPGAAARCSGMPWRSICCARWPSDRSVERRRAATLGAPSAPRDGGGSPSWHVTPVSFTSEVYLPHRARRHGAHSPVPGNPNSFTSFSSRIALWSAIASGVMGPQQAMAISAPGVGGTSQ